MMIGCIMQHGAAVGPMLLYVLRSQEGDIGASKIVEFWMLDTAIDAAVPREVQSG